MAARRGRLPEKARRAIAEFAMIPPEGRVLVAVSGGPDSMALLSALHDLGYSLRVAHFDHITRNGASADDARFVEAAAKALGLPFDLERCDVAAEAAREGQSFEVAARRLRYAFLLRTARARGCAVIATGHHADDQAETALMRILRGAAPHGLAGIPPVREEEGVRIVRPLLFCARAEILAYLDERRIRYREDETNREPNHLRNRIRHELLPLLANEYNPAITAALARLADLERAEDELLESLTEGFTETCATPAGAINRAAFREGRLALQRRFLADFARAHGVEPSFEHIEQARRLIVEGETGAQADLSGGVILRNGREMTEVVSGGPEGGPVELPIGGEARAFGRRFRARLIDRPAPADFQSYCHARRQVFSAGTLGRRLLLRRRRPGDRFTPFGMTGSKKVKDYCIDRGLTGNERNALVILEGDGRIAWLVGHAISAHVAVAPGAAPFIEVEVFDETE